jgi:hypothetical protein
VEPLFPAETTRAKHACAGATMPSLTTQPGPQFGYLADHRKPSRVTRHSPTAVWSSATPTRKWSVGIRRGVAGGLVMVVPVAGVGGPSGPARRVPPSSSFPKPGQAVPAAGARQRRLPHRDRGCAMGRVGCRWVSVTASVVGGPGPVHGSWVIKPIMRFIRSRGLPPVNDPELPVPMVLQEVSIQQSPRQNPTL